MSKKLFKKIVIGMFLFVLALLLIQFAYYVKIQLEKQSNHKKVIQYVTNDLSYATDSLELEADYINNWLESGHFTNADTGRLYERASLIYMQLGENMTYYRYLGYALYYLEQSSEKDYTVNIYLDLANFHYNNYAFEDAKKMIVAAQNVESFYKIKTIQIKSYAYRMLGIMAINDGEYDKAEEYLLESQEIVTQDADAIYASAYVAINDTWLARVYYEQGRMDEAQALIDKYTDSPFFTQDAYREIMLRDMIIPYYQTNCFLTVAKEYDLGQDYIQLQKENSSSVINDFVAFCEETGYEKCALNTLLTIQNKYPIENPEMTAQLYQELNVLYNSLFEKQNKDYANIISSQVNDSKSSMRESIRINNTNKRKTKLFITGLFLIIMMTFTFILVIMNNRYDGLTMLFTRKIFNKDLNRLKRAMNTYAIIMIDIDDFKKINDTYGHPEGDKVLQRLGHIMANEAKSDTKAYRYGGEEFVFMLGKNTAEKANNLAERVRQAMEMQIWDFASDIVITISVGVSSGSGQTDVLKQADDNLYYSKHHGKNQVTST